MQKMVLLGAALTSIAVWSQEQDLNLARYGLVGAVESVKSTRTIVASKPEDQQVSITTDSFNESGFLVSWSHESGSVKESAQYSYNDKNKPLAITEVKDGKESSYKFTYDENGYLQEKKIQVGGTLKATFTYVYNEQWELVRIDCKADDVSAESGNYKSIIYRYNAQKLPIEIVVDMGAYKNTTKLGYNALAQLVEEYYVSSMPGDNMNIGSYKYFTYNDNKQITEIVYKDIDAKVTKRESFTYDHLDRLTHHSQLTVGGKVISYVHYTSFDDEDNWLKSTSYEGSKITEVTEREITYK